jgi:hypothetical protein
MQLLQLEQKTFLLHLLLSSCQAIEVGEVFFLKFPSRIITIIPSRFCLMVMKGMTPVSHVVVQKMDQTSIPPPKSLSLPPTVTLAITVIIMNLVLT